MERLTQEEFERVKLNSKGVEIGSRMLPDYRCVSLLQLLIADYERLRIKELSEKGA